MKKIAIIFFCLFCTLSQAQEQNSKYNTKYEKAINNTYKKTDFNDFILITNIINPFNNVRNEEDWQTAYKVTNGGGNIRYPIRNLIGPLLKNISLDELYDELMLVIEYNLKGEIGYIDFSYPPKVNIPIEIIESLEIELKKIGKIKIEPKRKDLRGVYYISRIEHIRLKDIRDEYNFSQPAVPDPSTPISIAPLWNGDLVIHLESFTPKYKYNPRSTQNIYPDMFNFKEMFNTADIPYFPDNWNTNESNIYISGTGKACISFCIINQTKNDITIDMNKISIKLSEPFYTSKIETFNIYIDQKSVNNKKVIVPAEDNIYIEFELDNLITVPLWYKLPDIFEYKMSFWYESTKSMFNYIIDERYDYDWSETVKSATWYREGYIMFRYMLNEDKQEMYYNRATNKYFY